MGGLWSEGSLVRYGVVRLAIAALVLVGSITLLCALTLIVRGDPATILLGPRATPESVAHLPRADGPRPAALRARLRVLRQRPARRSRRRRDQRPAGRADGVRGAAQHHPARRLGDRPRGADRHADRLLCRGAAGQPARPGAGGASASGWSRRRAMSWRSCCSISSRSGSAGFRCSAPASPAISLDQLHHLVLPTLALAVGWIGYIARLVRSSLLEVLGEPFIRTARAYGQPERRVVMKYALKLACIPTVAILGVGIGELMGGAVFVEIIFNRPGLGSLIFDAIRNRNYPIVQGGVLSSWRSSCSSTCWSTSPMPGSTRASARRSAAPAPAAAPDARHALRRIWRSPSGRLGLIATLHRRARRARWRR